MKDVNNKSEKREKTKELRSSLRKWNNEKKAVDEKSAGKENKNKGITI